MDNNLICTNTNKGDGNILILKTIVHQIKINRLRLGSLTSAEFGIGEANESGFFYQWEESSEVNTNITEIWVRDQHEVTSPAHNTPAARFDKASLVVVYSDVRRLFLRFSSGKLSILLVALHGSHRATEKSIISAWWTHTLTLLQAHQRQSCFLIGGDLNASLGGVTSDYIHWVAPEDEDLPGSWVHDIAKRYALFAPATFPECRAILHLHPKEWWSSLSAGLCTGPSGLGLRTCDLLVWTCHPCRPPLYPRPHRGLCKRQLPRILWAGSKEVCKAQNSSWRH